MKKIVWIVFTVIAVSAFFQAGLIFGERRESELAARYAFASAGISDTIAVINLDQGANNGGAKENYASAIIETLSKRYMLVSANIAYNGYEKGSYGAIITFPSDVSEKILSLNTQNPEKVRLDFIINPLMREEQYIETYTEILNLQSSINKAISQMYVSSVYKEFQNSQDEVAKIFENDKADMAALNEIKLGNFTEYLNLGDIPETEFEPEGIDMTPYMTGIADMAAQVSDRYLDSYGQAKSFYDSLETEMVSTIAFATENAEDWLTALDMWAKDFEEILLRYEIDITAYAAEVTNLVSILEGYDGDLTEWYQELSLSYQALTVWHQELDDWNMGIGEWHQEIEIWDQETADWYQELDEWHQELDGWYRELAEVYPEIEAREQEINDWYQEVEVWYQELADWYQELEEWDQELEAWHRELAEQGLDDTVGLPPASPIIPSLSLSLPPSLSALVSALLIAPPFMSAPQPALPPAPPASPLILPPPAPVLYDGMTAEIVNDSFAAIKVPEPFSSLDIPVSTSPDELNELMVDLSDQLNSYDPDEYLSDSEKAEVDRLLSGYSVYLDSVSFDLGGQYDLALGQLENVYHDHNRYFGDWKYEALAAQETEQTKLEEVLNVFYDVKSQTSNDTLARLSSFAVKLPESRTSQGLNTDLIDFTVQPFEFVMPAGRTVIPANVAARETRHLRSRNILLGMLGAAAGVLVLQAGLAVKRTARVRPPEKERVLELS